MPVLHGYTLPIRPLTYSLSRIPGLGPHLAKQLLAQAKLPPHLSIRHLTQQESTRLAKTIEQWNEKIGAKLREKEKEDILRLTRLGTYRGIRLAAGLPSRGQKTRGNAITAGKRVGRNR